MTTSRRTATDKEREETLAFFTAKAEPEPEASIPEVAQNDDWICSCGYPNQAGMLDCKICLRIKGESVETASERLMDAASQSTKPHAPKLCATCHEIKPRSEFGGHGRSADGLQSACKACATLARQKPKKPEVKEPLWQRAGVTFREFGLTLNEMVAEFRKLHDENVALRARIAEFEARAIMFVADLQAAQVKK